jgi:cytochrome c oxidase subunit IV
MAESHSEHAGPSFQLYIAVFLALCVCTAISFIAHLIFGHGHTGAAVIMGVSCVKAALVIAIFMHLMYDWGKLFCVVVPVCIVTFMMVIVLLPDIVLGWK